MSFDGNDGFVPKRHRPSYTRTMASNEDDSVYSNQSFVRDHGLDFLGSGAEEFLATRPPGETLQASMSNNVIANPRGTCTWNNSFQ
jgi:hypothetical protein